MPQVKVRVKTAFGEIVVESEDVHELLATLENFPENFVEIVTTFLSRQSLLSTTKLTGIVELTTEGPVLITREKLTHYEAIGLVLYASEDQMNTSTQISKLLESSGIRSMVPARLNEMTKRGHVFKPDPNRPEFKLTVQGERWLAEEVLVRLANKSS
jgi:hypothetical protein